MVSKVGLRHLVFSPGLQRTLKIKRPETQLPTVEEIVNEHRANWCIRLCPRLLELRTVRAPWAPLNPGLLQDLKTAITRFIRAIQCIWQACTQKACSDTECIPEPAWH